MKTPFMFPAFMLIMWLCFGCTSASHDTYPRYTAFPAEERLPEPEGVKCDSVYLRYPYRVEIKDSLAVLLDLHPDRCFLHAFTYPGWQPVVSFGRRGEGPDEVLSAERVRICSPDSVWVLDSNRRQLTRWRITASEGKAERVEEIALDARLIRTLDFCKTEDGFLVTDYSGSCRYHRLDAQGKIRESAGKIPSEHTISDTGKTALAQAWRSFMDYNPKNGVLAMVTQLGEVIEVFNLNTGAHSVYYGPGGEPVFSISESEAIPQGIKGFNDVVVADSCIYAVFDGVPFKERLRMLRAGKKALKGGKSIYVFGLDGRPLKKMLSGCSTFGIELVDAGIYTVGNDKDIPLYSYKYLSQ